MDGGLFDNSQFRVHCIIGEEIYGGINLPHTMLLGSSFFLTKAAMLLVISEVMLSALLTSHANVTNGAVFGF